MLLQVVQMVVETRFQRFFLPRHGSSNQCGFRWNFGCRDASFVIRRALETCREHNVPAHAVFVDLKTAFPSCSSTLLDMLFVRFGIPADVRAVLAWARRDSSFNLRVGKVELNCPVSSGTPQGRVISPTEFVVLMLAWEFLLEVEWQDEWCLPFLELPEDEGRLLTVRTTRASTKRAQIGRCLRGQFYADDGGWVLPANRATTAAAMNLIVRTAGELSLKVHVATNEPPFKSKSQFVVCNPDGKVADEERVPIPLECGGVLPNATGYKHLGTWVDEFGYDSREFGRRVSAASNAWRSFYANVFKQAYLPVEAKVTIFRSIVLPALLYGCELWAVSDNAFKILSKFYNKRLRMLVGVTKWDGRSTRSLEQQLGMQPLWWHLDVRAWRWIGELLRMDEGRRARQFAWVFLGSSRSRGAQRLNWRGRVKKLVEKVAETLVRKGGPVAELVDVKLGGSPRPWNRMWSGPGGFLDGWERLALDQQFWESELVSMLAIADGATINVYEAWQSRKSRLERRAGRFKSLDRLWAAMRSGGEEALLQEKKKLEMEAVEKRSRG